MLEHIEAALQRPNFIAFVVLFLWGLFIMVTHPNLVKKLIGMYLVQTSIIFLLVTISAKQDATVPILQGKDAVMAEGGDVDPAEYANPLPHVLTLTAIVVQVATLGVSLALVTAIYRRYGSLDEDELLKRIE
ncbi:MAG TPA: NADH-quinone oxidoreductase subunit J [Marine Group III euryarchaeote]|nr:NADH-quinone oxidoreductase subunit J [Marine Group III euryarchaeote]